MIRFFLFALLLGVVAIYYAFRVSGGYRWIKGSGNIVTVQETVDPYNQITVHHGFNLKMVHGDSFELTIDIDDNLIDYLEVYTEDGCLSLGMKSDVIIRDGTLNAVVKTNDIEFLKGTGATKISLGNDVVSKNKFEMKLSGACEIKGTIVSETVSIINSGAAVSKLKIHSRELFAKLSGASEFKASGQVEEVNMTVSGASSIRAGDLVCERADVRLSGASNLKLNVQQYIEMTASGGSDIVIIGHPQVGEQNVGAASSIKFK